MQNNGNVESIKSGQLDGVTIEDDSELCINLIKYGLSNIGVIKTKTVQVVELSASGVELSFDFDTDGCNNVLCHEVYSRHFSELPINRVTKEKKVSQCKQP